MTTTDRSTVVGVFSDDAQARQAINALQQAGFNDDQISYSGHETSSGGFLAGLKSFFTGQEHTAGGAYDDLVGMGMPEQDARSYQREYETGRSIVAVTGGSRMREASALLAQYGGYGASRGTASAAGYDATAAPGQTWADTDEARRIQLREEQLQVYKQPVQVGEVGLRKEVVAEQQTLDVPMTHEEVYIERRAGSGQVSDTPIGEGGTIRVPVSAEQVNVSKQTVETGEVSIGKRAEQETRRVTDTVRHEEARIDSTGDTTIEENDTGVQRQ